MNMRIQRMIVTALGAGLLLWGGAAFGQSGTCTPITSVPTTITSPGVFCLTGNLRYTSQTGHAIGVDVSDVLIDFNGYRLLYDGPAGGSATGVRVRGADKNVTIRNGLISDFNAGIDSTASATIVEDMRLSDITYGISVTGEAAVIRRNYCRLNSACIATYGNNPMVVDNDIVGQTSGGGSGTGITMSGQNGLVAGNRLTRLAFGIVYGLSGTFRYRDNLTSNVTVPFGGGTDAGNNN